MWEKNHLAVHIFYKSCPLLAGVGAISFLWHLLGKQALKYSFSLHENKKKEVEKKKQELDVIKKKEKRKIENASHPHKHTINARLSASVWVRAGARQISLRLNCVTLPPPWCDAGKSRRSSPSHFLNKYTQLGGEGQKNTQIGQSVFFFQSCSHPQNLWRARMCFWFFFKK